MDGKPNKRQFKKLPLGTRFKYDIEGMNDVYVILDHYGRDVTGLVARWEGVDSKFPVVMQGVFCFAESEAECRTLEVIIFEL